MKKGATMDVRMIPVAKLVRSPNNPRHADEGDAGIVELADSIKALGVLQPLVVREDPADAELFEVLAGERRLVAAKRAGLTEVPCSVVEALEPKAITITVTENLQRENLTPMEEADGMRLLLDEKWSPAMIAAQVGRHVSYVFRRLALARLCAEWREALANDPEVQGLSAGHLEEVARLPEELQMRLLKQRWIVNRSAQELRAYVKATWSTELAAAPWDVTAVHDDLLENVGGCAECAKRTGRQRELFADFVDGTAERCLDLDCFERKKAQHLRNRMEELEKKHGALKRVATVWHNERGPDAPVNPHQWTPAKKGEPGAVPVFVVDGEDAGKVKWAKVDEPAKREQPTPPAEKTPLEKWMASASDQATEMLAIEIKPKLKKDAELLFAAMLLEAPWKLTHEAKRPLSEVRDAVKDWPDWLLDRLMETLVDMTADAKEPEGIAEIMEYAGRGKDWEEWLAKNPVPDANHAKSRKG